MNSDGEIFIDTKGINHNLEDFEKVKEEIKEINPQNLTVFMESTGTYHLPVERYFKENGFNTLVINSLTTNLKAMTRQYFYLLQNNNKKAEGKHYYESLTACSTKILRMLYSMCKNNKQFLEN